MLIGVTQLGVTFLLPSTAVPATLNGNAITISHQANIGQPQYSGTPNNAVSLICAPVLDINGNATGWNGTEYRLTYNFKKDYSYSIVINAGCIGGTSANLRILPNNGGSGSSTQCNGPAPIDPNTSGNLYRNNGMIGGTNWTDYSYNYGPFSAAQSLLNISAVPPSSGGSQTILVRKITINESAPPFEISPSSVQINCGYPITQNFTLNNPNGISGITGYVWDLGTTPNGWIYNGSPAPQTINTATNTIQLSSTCSNTAPKNVSSTVYVNGSPHSTLTSVVNFNLSLPTFSIDGSSAICNTNPASYNIAEFLPCDGTVTWAASPTGIVSLSSVGNTVQLTKTANGNIILTATISSSCGTKQATKNIAVGTTAITSLQIVTSFCLAGRNVKVQVNPVDNNASYTWSVTPPATNSPVSGSPFTIVRSFVQGNVTVTVDAQNACGNSNFSQSVFMASCSGFRAPHTSEGFSIELSPNPATDHILVTIDKESEEVKTLSKEENVLMELYDLKTYSLARRWAFKNNQNRFTLGISKMQKGHYVLVVNKGKYEQAKQIIIE